METGSVCYIKRKRDKRATSWKACAKLVDLFKIMPQMSLCRASMLQCGYNERFVV